MFDDRNFPTSFVILVEDMHSFFKTAIFLLITRMVYFTTRKMLEISIGYAVSDDPMVLGTLGELLRSHSFRQSVSQSMEQGARPLPYSAVFDLSGIPYRTCRWRIGTPLFLLVLNILVGEC